MPTFTINDPSGKTYTIEGDNAAGALVALKKHLGQGPEPDKYQQAAIDEQAALKAVGGDEGAGFTRRLAHGFTLGADTTALAALETPLEMIKRGTFNPVEGYNYAKAREDQILADARKNTGIPGTAVEALGGAVGAGGLAKAGITAAAALPQGASWLARAGAQAADAAGVGGISGFMEGNGVNERVKNGIMGALAGGALGFTLPGVISAAKMLASPITSQIAARMNPQQYAQAQVARAISEGKMTARDVELALRHAHNEGQGEFTLADALGSPGQEMLSTVARSPGEGRTAVANFLDARQAGQGRRLSSALAEGFESPQTAAQVRQEMTAARDTAANAEYGAVRKDAMPVDVSGAISKIDETLAPYGVAQDVGSNDTAAAALAKYRSRLTRPDGRTNNDFNAVQRVRGDLSDEIQQAVQSGARNKARLLGQVLREVDNSLETSSAGFKQANKNFAQASKDIEAIDTGRQAATRGRTEDTIPTFQKLSPEGQQAFRSGYVDPLIESAQGSAMGVNKARPFTSDAAQQEIDAFAAPGRADALKQKIERENTMFATRNRALGGSKTADNLANEAAMGVSPEVLSVAKHIISGNFGGAVKGALTAGKNAFTGNTPEVRQAVAELLLQNGKNLPPKQLQALVDHTISRANRASEIAEKIARGAAGGGAAVIPGQTKDRLYVSPAR